MGTLYVMQGGSFVEQGGGGGGSTSTSSSVNSVSGTTSLGVQLAAPVTPHSKPATFTTLIASTAHDAETIMVELVETIAQSSTDTSAVIDIAFGASSSEVVKIPDLEIGYRSGAGGVGPQVLPFAVPAGTRISARLQSAVASETATIGIRLMGAGDHSAAPTTCTAYGYDSANTRGTLLTTVGSTNTKGTWTVLSASTGADASRMFIVAHPQGSSSGGTSNLLVDIGVGAASSEVVIIPDLFLNQTTGEVLSYWSGCMPFTVNVPAGSRLVARYAASQTAANLAPRVIAYGFD